MVSIENTSQFLNIFSQGFVKTISFIKRHDVRPFQKYTNLQLNFFACVYHKYAKRQCYISFYS